MIDSLKENINLELRMVSELGRFLAGYQNSQLGEKRIYQGLIKSMLNRMRIVNSSIPSMLKDISVYKKIRKDDGVMQEVHDSHLKDTNLYLNQRGKEEYLKELNISDRLIKKIKEREKDKSKKVSDYRKPSIYSKISNKIFLNLSNSVISKGGMKNLTLNIKKSNMNVLSTTYISMIFFSTTLAFFFGTFLLIFLGFFEINLSTPFINYYSGNFILRILKLSWIPVLTSLLTWMGFYFYPNAERGSLGSRIDQELPFVVIHMGSISGSGIEPLEILKIVGMSKEYKYAGQEVRKIINQTNLYGYDLSTALRNVAFSSPSSKFAELLNGMSVTINSGGDISNFFEKRAESLLLDYRLEREKSTKSAETFMDMYISIVIATPMILLMVLMMISVSGIQTGFSAGQMAVAIIGIVAIVNILFLTFLHLKQPTY